MVALDEASVATITLNSFSEGHKPGYLAQVDGKTVRIILQASAIAALAEANIRDLGASLEGERPAILLTAQLLYDNGFYIQTDAGLEITISALDILQATAA